MLSGSVFLQGGNTGVAGVDMILTGTTTTGRTVDTSTITDSNGAYSFDQLLPGTYSLNRIAPSNIAAGNQPALSGFSLSQGESISNLNFTVLGLAPSNVSLAYFLTLSTTPRFTIPTPGSGVIHGFTLDSANPLTNHTLNAGSTTYLDLSGNFLDPNTTNGTMLAFNTSLGTINVKLFDRDAPQTVTNFLNNIQAGDYANGLFSRLSNLGQISPITPPPTPYQVLQGGGSTVNADLANNVTGFNSVTGFQPIQDESNDTLHSNIIGALAMAQTSPGTATTGYFFNLTDNSQSLANSAGNGFAVFGMVADSQSLSILEQFASQYTPTNESSVNSNFFALPVKNGFTANPSSLTGTPTSDLAVVNSVSIVTPPTGALTYSILSNSNPAVVTPTLGSDTSGSTFSANQLQLVGNSTGSAVITLQVTDSKGESVIKQFTVTVVGLNLPNPGNQSNLEGDAVNLSEAGTDTTGLPLTYSATNLPAGLTIDHNTGIISGNIGSQASSGSPYSTTVTATDGTLSRTQSFTWTVNPVVTITATGDQTNLEGDSVNLQVTATDAKDRPLTYSLFGTLPPNLSLDANSGLISGTIANDASTGSPYSAMLVVSDGTFQATYSFNWVVNPVVTISPIGNQSNVEGDPVNLQVMATDANSLPLTYTAANLPTGLGIDMNSGLISGTVRPGASAGNPYSSSVTVSDGTFSTTQMFTWTISA